MPRDSGSTSRVIDVLNFLASRPTERFTLSEIAGELGLSNGSAHRVLTALTSAGYLYRHPRHKTYSLGVGLVAVGQAALEQHRGVEAARRAIALLAQELKVQCMLTTVIDDAMVFLAREGMPQTEDALYRVGERRPFLPPLGLVTMAWAPGPERRAYLERARTLLGKPVMRHLTTALDKVRERGYATAANGDSLRALSRAAPLPLGRERAAGGREELEALLAALTRDEIFLTDPTASSGKGIAYISAPIFSPEGAVAYEITLSGLPADLPPDEAGRYIKRVCAAGAVLTSETYGKLPRSSGI